MQAEADQQAEAMKLAQMRQLLGAAAQAGGAIAGGIQQQRQDEIANSLMNEEANIPRAQAVDPAAQGPADAKAAKMPGFHTGGMDEMKLTMAMEDQKMQRIASDLAVAREARYNAMMDQQANARQQAAAADAFRSSSKDMQEAFNDSMAYYKTSGVGLKAAAEATTQEEYDAAASGVMSMYNAAVKRGLDVQQPKLPPFMTPEQKAAMAAQQQAIADERTAIEQLRTEAQNAGGMDKVPDGAWWKFNLGNPTYGDTIKARESKLQAMPGYSGAPSAPASSAPALRPGMIIRQGGQTFRINAQGQPEPI